jgi:hypothetical protein
MNHKFLGFVITDEKAEFYLEKLEIIPGDCALIYADHPSKARLIKSAKIAYETCKMIGQSTRVYRLYETATHYAIAKLTEDDIYTVVSSNMGVDKKNNVYRLF